MIVVSLRTGRPALIHRDKARVYRTAFCTMPGCCSSVKLLVVMFVILVGWTRVLRGLSGFFQQRDNGFMVFITQSIQVSHFRYQFGNTIVLAFHFVMRFWQDVPHIRPDDKEQQGSESDFFTWQLKHIGEVRKQRDRS
jgi:hypothetical protein